MSVEAKTWNHQDGTKRCDQPLFEIKPKLMGTPLAVYEIYLLKARFELINQTLKHGTELDFLETSITDT